MNGIATIIVRVSSIERCKKQNVIVQDFKHLKNKEIPSSNENYRSHQK